MDLLLLLGLVAVGSVLGLVGGVAFLVNEKLKNILCRYSTPFAAGILITVALLDLIPEAVEHNGELGYLYVLVSFFIVFSFEHLFFRVHHHESDKKDINAGTASLVIAGDTIHNFIDGVAIAAAFVVDPTLGLVVAISTFLHEVPHEIGDFGVLLAAGWKKMNIFLANFASACSTFLGALVVYFFAQNNDALIGVLMAISGGLFLYLGASDFLPSAGDEDSKGTKVIAVIFGATVMIFVTLMVPHVHG